MFREMRRKKKEIDRNAAETLLQSSRRGVLAVNWDDGYPYAIPVNYIYDREAQKFTFMERVQDTKQMLFGPATRYVLRFMEMRPLKKKHGRHICRA